MSQALPSDDSGARIEPGLSVFLPNFNHGRFLPEALDALLAQSLRPGRIHIVDDASTDGSQAIIETYRRRYPETITAELRSTNRGFARNLEDWLAESDAEFMLLAAADDRILPGLFEKSVAMLRRYPQAGLCSSESGQIAEDGRDLGWFRIRRPLSEPGLVSPAQARHLLMTTDSWFMGNTIIYRAEALRAAGFRPELGAFADGFLCRVIALRQGVCFIPESLGLWRRMETGMAAQSLVNAGKTLFIMDRAQALMKESPAGPFPPGYARRWRGRWLFSAVEAILSLPREESARALKPLLDGLGPADRWAIRLISFLPVSLARLLLFAWLRPFDLPLALGEALRPRQEGAVASDKERQAP